MVLSLEMNSVTIYYLISTHACSTPNVPLKYNIFLSFRLSLLLRLALGLRNDTTIYILYIHILSNREFLNCFFLLFFFLLRVRTARNSFFFIIRMVHSFHMASHDFSELRHLMRRQNPLIFCLFSFETETERQSVCVCVCCVCRVVCLCFCRCYFTSHLFAHRLMSLHGAGAFSFIQFQKKKNRKKLKKNNAREDGK